MQCNFVVKALANDLFLTSYSTVLGNCQWGNVQDAVCFDTQEQANNTISSWGQEPGVNFVGQNPPPR